MARHRTVGVLGDDRQTGLGGGRQIEPGSVPRRKWRRAEPSDSRAARPSTTDRPPLPGAPAATDSASSGKGWMVGGVDIGLYIYTSIEADIDPCAWQELWDESLAVLRSFPLPLVRLSWQNRRGIDILGLSTELQADTDDRSVWRIDGDLLSRRRMETFDLSRDWQRYRPEQVAGAPLTWSNPKDPWAGVSGGIELFGNKTQGRPAHFAILAVAHLIEHRFPGRSFVSGDLTPDGCEWVRSWLAKTIDEPVRPLLCLDAQALWTRLGTHCATASERMHRFESLFCGGRYEAMRTLWQQAEQPDFVAHQGARIASYGSMSCRGSVERMRHMMALSRDLALVIAVARAARSHCQETPSDGYDLTQLLEMLCGQGITAPPALREICDQIRRFDRAQHAHQTIHERISSLLMDMVWALPEWPVQIDGNELLEAFCAHEPEQRSTFAAIIAAADRRHADQLSELELHRAAMEQVLNQAAPEAAADVVAEPLDWLRQEAERQAPARSACLEFARHFSAEIREHSAHGPGGTSLFEHGQDRDTVLQLLCEACRQQSILLTAEEWHHIETGADAETLTLLAILAQLPVPSDDLRLLRDILLATPALWPHLRDHDAPPAEPGHGRSTLPS